MLELKEKCARCGVSGIALLVKKIHRHEIKKQPGSFDEMEDQHIRECELEMAADHGVVEPRVIDVDYEYRYEAFCICTVCKMSTVFILKPFATSKAAPEPGDLEKHAGSLHDYLKVVEQVSARHFSAYLFPEDLPEKIKYALEEGEACLAVGYLNAACTMFRLCLELVAHDEFEKLSDDEKKKLPRNPKTGKSGRVLATTLECLFENGKIPANFHDLADCIRNYGNDSAHQGNLCKKDKRDVEKLLDFTRQILVEVYTRWQEVSTNQENAALLTAQRKMRRNEKSGA